MENEIQLKALANNPALMEAVKTYIISFFDGPMSPDGKNDELLGQIFRARLVVRETVEAAFNDIKRLQEPSQATGEIAKHR